MPARSLVPSFGAIGSLIGAHRVLMVIVTLFAIGVTPVAFAGEQRDLAVANVGVLSMLHASGCVACTSVRDAVPSRHADDVYRGYGVGSFAYANPENDAVRRFYYGDPIHASPRAHVVHRTIKPRHVSARMHRHAVEPHMKTLHHQARRPVARVKKLARRAPPPASNVRVASTFAALPSIVTLGRPAFNAAGVRAMPVPNVVVVNGQHVEIVPPDEVNGIDLAADRPGLEQADVQSTPLAASASPTVLAQALSVIAGALAGALVAFFLIRSRPVRICGPASTPRRAVL